MSRLFRPGDKVKAFLDANICGHIVKIHSKPSTSWIANGTASVEYYADVKLGDGRICHIKLSELTHDDI